MTIAHNIVARLGVAFVAVAMLFTLAAPAQAQTAEELQQMINDLLAQVSALQSQLGQGQSTGMGASDVCPYTWTRSLTVGDTGNDVLLLQQFLNADPDTRVAATGVGSAGQETEYYGQLTGAAVAKFQAKYRSEILSPLGLVNPTTYFGPSTMAQANDLCAVAMADDTADDVADDANDDVDEPGAPGLGNDEGSIREISEVSADESNLEEGTEGGVLAFTVEIEGDLEINRMDVYAAEDGSASDDADDYFVRAFLLMDGEEIAEIDVDDFDQNDYDVVDSVATDDDYRLRFSGLDLVFEDGDEPEFQVGFEVLRSVDSADLGTDWGVELDSIRFVDGEGFSDSEDSIGVYDSFGFDAEEVAQLSVTKSSDSPDATTLEVDDNDTSEEYDIFAIDIEEENGVDLTIEDMTFTASTTLADVTTTVDEAILYFDGEEVGSESPTAAGVLAFENLGIDIDADDTVTVTLALVFNESDDYTEGDSVFVTFTSIDDAEDENGNDEGDMTIDGEGTVDSDTFTLRSEGVALEMTSESFTLKVNDDTDATDDEGVYTYKYEVSAFGDDFYFNKTAVRGTTATTSGAEFVTVTDGGNTVYTAGTTTASLSSTADTDGTRFVVRRGDTETFTLKVTFDPAASNFYALRLGGVNYATSTTETNFQAQAAVPVSDFDTDEESI